VTIDATSSKCFVGSASAESTTDGHPEVRKREFRWQK